MSWFKVTIHYDDLGQKQVDFYTARLGHESEQDLLNYIYKKYPEQHSEVELCDSIPRREFEYQCQKAEYLIAQGNYLQKILAQTNITEEIESELNAQYLEEKADALGFE